MEENIEEEHRLFHNFFFTTVMLIKFYFTKINLKLVL